MDIRAVLTFPAIYNFFGLLIGSKTWFAKFVSQHVHPNVGDTILDIGCGPAEILKFLPEVNYIGFDISEQYIDAARIHFKNRGTFYCRKVSKDAVQGVSCDIILASGILHHLDDMECMDLFELAHISMKKGGRLITIDGCYVKRQSRLIKYILSKDRGQFVRTQEQYLELAKSKFTDIEFHIRSDLLSIPYTHIIMECTK